MSNLVNATGQSPALDPRNVQSVRVKDLGATKIGNSERRNRSARSLASPAAPQKARCRDCWSRIPASSPFHLVPTHLSSRLRGGPFLC